MLFICLALGCRNVENGERVLTSFREKGITTGSIDVYKLDVSSLDSVKTFAKIIKGKYPKIHYLINNGKFNCNAGRFTLSKTLFQLVSCLDLTLKVWMVMSLSLQQTIWGIFF